jgi:hypothetical protein
VRDGQLASKAKLKAGQIQDQAQEKSIGDKTCSADSISQKVSMSFAIIVGVITPGTAGHRLQPKIPDMMGFPQWHTAGAHTPRIRRQPCL